MITEAQILNARILIVDDDRIGVKILEEVLAKAGFPHVHSTTDSRQVVSMYGELKPDLLILDLWMPEMTGFDIMKELTRAYPETFLPIVVLSHDADQKVQYEALESGAKDFLNKPYDRVEVLIRFRNIIEAHLLHLQIQQQNKHLEHQVAERTRQLSETQLDVITRLARAIEYRDSETGYHIIRMSQYAACLAKAAGMSELACDQILRAAPLHDIGKIGIPDSILQKPGSLTDEEWKMMKSHTTIGAELLSGSASEFMEMARTIALTHHEKWDGSGYPEGLKEEDIPLVGRICGLCDVFDALMTARPYKGAWGSEQTLDEIRKCRGKHFDPELTDLFFEILPDIFAIQHKYLDSNDGSHAHKAV